MIARLTDDPTVIDWERLALVFKIAPLGERVPAKLKQAFENSTVRCFAWHDDELIGAGRAISDGIAYAAIFDVVLLPVYQGKGIGRQIMTFLAERSKGRKYHSARCTRKRRVLSKARLSQDEDRDGSFCESRKTVGARLHRMNK